VIGEPASISSRPLDVAAATFEGFFEAEYVRLCQALVLLTGDPLDAEEIAQEAMTRVLERWDRVARMDSPTGYLFRTAMNLHRNRLRTIRVRARRLFHERPVSDHSSTVGDQQDVRAALAKLSRAEREALVLVDWQQMDAAEAGGALGITAGAVRVRVHRARAALRHHLGETTDE
jgi:RNA polymerase sigma factor (sigma-70 family)